MSKNLIDSTFIKETAHKIGFQDCGIARSMFLEDEYALFKKSIDENRNASMKFLERNIEGRFNPEYLLPNCKSVIVVTYNYLTSEVQKSNKYLIARYAWIEDYHTLLFKLLTNLAEIILTKYPNTSYKITVDSSIISEKNWAAISGVGVFGKNGLIHNDKGSFFVIGTLLIDKYCSEYDKPATFSDCGECSLCQCFCPTNALSTPFCVDANKCISYLNTESKSPDFNDLAKEKFIFGCDICQEICPKNKKNSINLLNETKTSLFLPLENNDFESLTEDAFARYFAGTAILRRKYHRFRKVVDAKKEYSE